MKVTDTLLEKESKDRYLTYALSVVSGRALPDVRDGLKPVQRRILYAMQQNLSLSPTSSHKKSATVVGEVLGKFHPHGDVACYEAMVRMAQDFSLRYPLVDGQGNFGSLDGDSAAAYRYTEVKLHPLAIEVIGEIDEETVNFRDNFDSSTTEPVVFPSRVPNLLMNGASGIAVGMATNIPPHNLKDLAKALVELSLDPELTNAKLAGIVKAPDFPTGCAILNSTKELSEMYQSGKGSVRMRGEWKIEEQARGKQAIIVTAIPYAVNKSQLVEKIADLIIQKKVPQLSDVRDESTDIVRVVIELVSGADAEIAMAYLFKNTPLEQNFAVNMTALVPAATGKEGITATRPELLSLKACLQHFLDFREEVVERRLQFERKKLLERIHILEGLVKIFDALDLALKIVRSSDGRSDAATKLGQRFNLTEIQAFAIVDMRIYQLSKTNIKEIKDELALKAKRVQEIDKLLKSKEKIREVIRNELEALADKFGDKRKCRLVKDNVDIEFNAEAYVVQEDVFAIVTKDGWLKRIRQSNELAGTRLREGDVLLRAHALNTIDSVVFFTNLGMMYSLKVSDFPSSSGYGDPVQKVLKFKDGEAIVDSFGVKADGTVPPREQAPQGKFLCEGDEALVVSSNGVGFTTKIEALDTLKRSGRRVLKPREGTTLAAVCRLADTKEVAFFTFDGSALAVKRSESPVRSDAAVGVALMGVRGDDKIVAALPYAAKAKYTLMLASGKEKEVAASEIIKGHRGLKGQKIVSKAEVLGVETNG